jgi:bifunctional pyridoxal-dependent enzyme with beta-cystathionase and maltose regulon repressor activities
MARFSFTVKELRNRVGRKWQRYSDDVIPLWIADHDFPVAPEVRDAICEAVHRGDLNYGLDAPVRELMAAKVRRVNGIPVDAGGVYVTQGVLPAMWLACRYTCEPGDEVIITDPMYWPFLRAVERTGTRKVEWMLDEAEGYRFDVDALNEAVTSRTKLLFLCNPHNPTGRVMTREELQGIADLVVDRNLTVMVDELWEDIVYDGRQHRSLAAVNDEVSERTVTAFGFSKTYGVAGLQLGYAVSTNNELVEGFRKIASGVLRGTSTLSLAAAKTVLSGDVAYYVEDLRAHLHEVRTLTSDAIEEMEGVSGTTVEGTFLAFPNVESYGLTSRDMSTYLLEKGRVAVTDGSVFGSVGEGHVRINFGSSRSVLTEAFQRMTSALSAL